MRWLYIINIIAIKAFYRKYIIDTKIKKSLLNMNNKEQNNISFTTSNMYNLTPSDLPLEIQGENVTLSLNNNSYILSDLNQSKGNSIHELLVMKRDTMNDTYNHSFINGLVFDIPHLGVEIDKSYEYSIQKNIESGITAYLNKISEKNMKNKNKNKNDGTDGRPDKTEYNNSFEISRNMDILEKTKYLERNKYMYENKDINILDEKTTQILYDYYGLNSISSINMNAGGLFRDW